MGRVSNLNKTFPTSVRAELMALGRAMRARRIELRLSQREIAERIGISERTWRAIEGGSDTVNIGIVAMGMLVLGIGPFSKWISQQAPYLLYREQRRVRKSNREKALDDF